MDESAALLRLLEHHSPSGAEGAAVEAFVHLARELGMAARVDRAGNGIAERGRGRPRLWFLGHIDTVEGAREARRRRGRIHGRGSVDAKGPLACALVAAARFGGPGSVRVIAAVREETDSRGARALLNGPRPDAVIVGEPSGWDGVTIAYKGDLRLTLTFRGRRQHWSSPAPTAADRAIAWLGECRAVVDRHRGESLYRSMTMKAVGLSADPGADPEVAELRLDFRIPPGLTAAEVLDRLPPLGPTATLRIDARIDPVELGRADPVVRALVGGIRAAGGTPTLLRKAGTSDLNVVEPVWKVPAAAYGPGDSRLDHTDRESVPLADLAKGRAVLEHAFAALAAATLPAPAGVP